MMAPVFHIDRERLAPLLLRRFRNVAVPLLAGTTAFAVVHVVRAEPYLGFLLALKALQVAAVAVTYAFAAREPRREVIVVALVALTVVINFVTAATGITLGNINTNSILYVLVALATSSYLPWGVVAQGVSSGAAGLALLAPALLGRPLYPDYWYDTVALAVAFGLSMFIAREVERDTLAELGAADTARALAESRADFEAVFRSSNVLLAVVALTEDDFEYRLGNEATAATLGRTVATLPGTTGRHIGLDAGDIERFRGLLRQCHDSGSAQLPSYRFEVEGEPRWYHLSFSAIRGAAGEGPPRFIVVGTEMTELRHATEDVRRLNRNLEAQVRERTLLLEAANKDLESFAYSVSHDLRTPLRTIEGFAALIDTDHGPAIPEAARSQLERIKAASRTMAQLIDDMLVLSRATRVEMRREVVDVTTMVRDVAHELRGAWPGREVELVVEPGMVAYADARLLRIVLANLMGNAWKYTARRDDARVQVGTSGWEGERTFEVRDNGCGFDMRFVGKLFQPFQRLHAAEEYEGTGIGLATVARIIRRHDGRVAAEGAPGEGAVFRFSLGEGWPGDEA